MYFIYWVKLARFLMGVGPDIHDPYELLDRLFKIAHVSYGRAKCPDVCPQFGEKCDLFLLHRIV